MNYQNADKKYDFLLNIGFTLNEAKVYLTLIQYNELNGYEVSKYSGVSRSLVYDVLERLVNKGFVLKCTSNTNIYKALDYEKLIEKINHNNQNNLLIAKLKHLCYNCTALLAIKFNGGNHYVKIYRTAVRCNSCSKCIGCFCC